MNPTNLIIPPFTNSGEGGAEFYCLAFAPVKYRQGRTKPRLPASVGIYFCTHARFTRFSQQTFGQDGHLHHYTRSPDGHDNLDFLILSVLLESSVHPAAWRLFPRAQIPPTFHSDEYENARRELCRFLFQFRTRERARRVMAAMAPEPLEIFDDAFSRLALGDSKEEDEEICKAVVGKSGRDKPASE